MAVSENQLETWSHQGSKKQSAATYNTIKSALEDPAAPYHGWGYEVFLQGSYGNDTNIYSDSDVDIIMCLTSVYYQENGRLSETEQLQITADLSPGGISFDDFKSQVLSWLKSKFGSVVKSGKKAIFIPGNGARRDADVLVCVKHRDYLSYRSEETSVFWEGICFWTSDYEKIVNYPRQHLENCVNKNLSTYSRFKPNIRVLKNMRNAMIEQGYFGDGLAPSYFLEGMLWNVPAQHFSNSFQATIENCIYWLDHCKITELMCANDIHYLLRKGHSVCWNVDDFNTFRAAVKLFWNKR